MHAKNKCRLTMYYVIVHIFIDIKIYAHVYYDKKKIKKFQINMR